MSAPLIVAVVGAESTGKTTLARALGAGLARPDRRVAVVDETLREFCDRHGRTPRIDEQAGIAAEQTRRIAAAAASHDLVVADTTALMVAVYSVQVFGDRSLLAEATQAHALCDLTLLTALDLPWQADGHQRDGPRVRAPVDALLRAALRDAGLGHAVVAGSGAARTQAALDAVARALAPRPTGGPLWQWHCERCSEGDCERHALARG
jgi:nicotinamide riboside kinase